MTALQSLAAGFALAAFPMLAGALPTGENVRHGDVAVSRPGAQSMQIDQRTAKGIVDWNGFSIAAGEHVNVTQPGASSVLLNRVVGASPSEIFGRLTANGQVFLTNPNGVLFAPGASVEVGALFATTLGISDADFIAGRYTFASGGGAGSVINRGSITTLNGYTALAGPQVRNEGTIVAQAGTVALAAGERVTLDMVGDGLINVSVDQGALNASVVNSGTILADGGLILLTARGANSLLDSVINTRGLLRAEAIVVRGDEIVLEGGLSGGEATLTSSGTIDVTAHADLVTTGNVTLTGTVTLANSGVITAGGTVLLNGGSVTVGGSTTVVQPGRTVTPDEPQRREAIGAGLAGVVLRDAQNHTVNLMTGSVDPLPPMEHKVDAAGVSVPAGVTLP